MSPFKISKLISKPMCKTINSIHDNFVNYHLELLIIICFFLINEDGLNAIIIMFIFVVIRIISIICFSCINHNLTSILLLLLLKI